MPYWTETLGQTQGLLDRLSHSWLGITSGGPGICDWGVELSGLTCWHCKPHKWKVYQLIIVKNTEEKKFTSVKATSLHD